MSQKYDKQFLDSLYKRIDVDAFLDRYHAHTTGEVTTHRGREFRMHCMMPGHRDNSASASFNVEKGLYNCWSKCGGHDFWSLIQIMENVNFPGAVDLVKKWVGFSDDDQEFNELQGVIECLERLGEDSSDDNILVPKYVEIDFGLHPEFEDAMDHLDIVKSRVNEDMIRIWDLKYATSGHYNGRLIIPFKVDGKIVSFAARDMLGRADRWHKIQKNAVEKNLTQSEYTDLQKKFECKKIIYPSTSDFGSSMIQGSPVGFVVFNLDNVLQQGRDLDYVIITEGPFDAMKLFMWGFNSVAILGLKLSQYKKMKILENFSKVYVCLDNDKKDDGSNPGQDSALKIVESICDNVQVHNIVLPPGKDPDECTLEEFERCVDEAEEF